MTEQARDTGGLREAAQAYRNHTTAANGRALDAALAAHKERGLDVLPDCHCQHVTGGRCMFATPEAAPDE